MRRVVAVMGVLAVAAVGCGGSGSSGAHESGAWVACKNAVKEELRNPATADFALMKTQIDEQDDGVGWRVEGVVTAKTDFGVEKDISYTCETNGQATVTDVNVAQS